MSEKDRSNISNLLGSKVKEVVDDLMDEFIFTTILDYFRRKEGFPNAMPIAELLDTENITPKLSFIIPSADKSIEQIKICPICKIQVSTDRFAQHVSSCKERNGQEKLYEEVRSLF